MWLFLVMSIKVKQLSRFYLRYLVIICQNDLRLFVLNWA